MVAEHIIKLSKLFDVTTDFILKGDKMLIRMSRENGFIPYVKADAHASFLKNFDSDLAFEDQDWFRIPGFNPLQDQKLFEVEGESMVPTILPRDIIVCQVQRNINHLLPGSLILLVTNNSVMVKRFEKEETEGRLLLKNDNPEQEKQEHEVEKSNIRQIMVVRGKITGVLVPHHHITSQGKIQALEESIEFLKRELFLMNKKLSSLQKN